jgi:predicted aspartyl protease
MKCFLFALLICLPAMACAEPLQIIVPVTFSYHGTTVTADLAIDTGASTTTIDTRLAQRLGVTDREPSRLAQMADGRIVAIRNAAMDVTVSTKQRNALPVNIMDYSAGRRVEGMLGLDFIADMTLTIDWRNRRVYWSD